MAVDGNMWSRLLKQTRSIADDTPEAAGFFDAYFDFYATSATAPFRNRLNRRYEAIVAANLDHIRGRRILDLGSHDGRWSFAALQAGAVSVIGIEGRDSLVELACRNMRRYSVPNERYHFIAGDVHQELARLSPGSIDTVFCVGFFYHTAHHAYLLSEIKRLEPTCLILDTKVTDAEEPSILLTREDSSAERNAIAHLAGRKALVGVPSRSAVELLLRALGFRIRYFDWSRAALVNWDHLDDYRKGRRITLAATDRGRPREEDA